MADTLRPPAPPSSERLEPPPAARRYRFLTDRRLAFLFISPALALLVFLSIWPLIRLIWLSFTDYSVTRDVPASFIGLDNYIDVITSPVTQNRALTTLIFVVGAVALQSVLGFAIAFLISRRAKGRGALTTLFLIPMMLIALAGLTAVPRYLYEAAEIDRASEWFKFRRITLPLVWPLLLIAIMFRAIEAFRLFDLVYILTGGGPGGTTETLSYNVYKVAFFG